MLLKRYRYELILLTLMVVFIFAKANTLSVHLFWDETLYLIPRFLRNGFSELGLGAYHPHPWFGHPPLFQVIHYLINYFTETIRFSAHLTALISYLFFSFSCFLFFSKVIGKLEAICILVFFTVIPQFYAQSTMFLPNFLALGFGLLSQYFFAQKKITPYVFLVSLAFLTRESSLAFMVSSGVVGLIWLKREKLSFKKWLLSLSPFLLPIAYFAIIKIKTNSFVGHPFFSIERSEQAGPFSLFGDKCMFLDALAMSTTIYWLTPVLIILPLLFFYRVWKNKIHLKIKKQVDFDCLSLFSLTTTFYFAFFSLYAHTIPRDIILVSLFFHALIVMMVMNLFSNGKINTLILVLLAFWQALYLSPNQRDSFNRDQTESSQISNAYVMNKISSVISKKYETNIKIFAYWPASEVLRHPEYEYASKPFNVSDQDFDDAEVYVNAEIFSNYKKDFLKDENKKQWKLVDESSSNKPGERYQIYERLR